MRRRLTVLWALTLAIASTSVPATARDDTSEREKRQARALELVDNAVTAADQLKVPENRIRLLIAASDALWNRYPDRAKGIVRRIGKELGAALAGVDPESADGARRNDVFRSLRMETVNRLTERDPALALEFMAASRGSAVDNAQDRAIEIQLATALVESDPKRAVEVAEANIARGVSYNIMNVISSLRSRDPEGAAHLATVLLAKLKTVRLMSDQMTMSIAIWLLRESIDSATAPEESKTTPLLTSEQLRDLADYVFSAVLAIDPASVSPQELSMARSFVEPLEQALPTISRIAPDACEAVRRKIGEIHDALARYGSIGARDPYESATVDELVDAADDAPNGIGQSLIYRAAANAMSAGDVDRARAIITEKIEDPVARASYLDNIDRQALYTAMSSDRLEEARRLVSRIRSPAERVSVLVQLSAHARAANDPKGARGLLGEADQFVGDRATDQAMFEARMTLAQAYVDVDPARGLAIAEGCVAQLDALLDAAVAVDGFMCDRNFSEGELLLYQGGALANFVTQSGDTLAALGSADFDRAAAIASRFGRADARAFALVSVARAALSEN